MTNNMNTNVTAEEIIRMAAEAAAAAQNAVQGTTTVEETVNAADDGKNRILAALQTVGIGIADGLGLKMVYNDIKFVITNYASIKDMKVELYRRTSQHIHEYEEDIRDGLVNKEVGMKRIATLCTLNKDSVGHSIWGVLFGSLEYLIRKLFRKIRSWFPDKVLASNLVQGIVKGIKFFGKLVRSGLKLVLHGTSYLVAVACKGMQIVLGLFKGILEKFRSWRQNKDQEVLDDEDFEDDEDFFSDFGDEYFDAE